MRSNIPLKEVINWLVTLAPRGVIEFVDKADVRAQKLLRFRDDIFADYHLENFMDSISQYARVVRQKTLNSTRTLVWYESAEM